MLSDNKITEWRERLISMIIENYPNRWETFKSVKENVTAVKYGSGSVYLPRGYFCPSRVLDTVIGNVTRGRLLKTKPRTKIPTYRYGFDKNGKLITAEEYDEWADRIEDITSKFDVSDYQKAFPSFLDEAKNGVLIPREYEFIKRENGIEIGLRYQMDCANSNSGSIAICENGYLKKYFHLYNVTIKTVNIVWEPSFTSEEYEYIDSHHVDVVMRRLEEGFGGVASFGRFDGYKINNVVRYRFELDDNGAAKKYTLIESNGKVLSQEKQDYYTYEVYKPIDFRYEV